MTPSVVFPEGGNMNSCAQSLAQAYAQNAA